jgi:hypothetical protein
VIPWLVRSPHGHLRQTPTQLQAHEVVGYASESGGLNDNREDNIQDEILVSRDRR